MEKPERFYVDVEREADGRWLAFVAALPGVMTYGATESEATANAETLARQVLADRVAHREAEPDLLSVPFSLRHQKIDVP